MKRRVAREIALQSLYQIQVTQIDPREAIAFSLDEAQHDNEANLLIEEEELTSAYIEELVEGTCHHVQVIDRLLVDYLKGWKIERLSRVDKDILRLATYEMIYRDDIPPKAVINEALELAKIYSTDESSKFVNGVLGQMIHHIDVLKEKGKSNV